MDSDNVVYPDKSNIFDVRKIIDNEVWKIEERFLIKMDQKIIDHMKKEWENSKFNISLYALQKQIDELKCNVKCVEGIIRDVSREIHCDESEF